jgi:Fur family ferric uptake transcriptional regulator
MQIFAEKVAMNCVKDLTARVRQHGCRITWQRVAVLQALCELDGHASAEMMHKRIGRREQDVDLSTVYRTLERLRDLRILSQTDLGRGCAEYEIVTDQPHHHLICRRCGRVIDLNHTYLAAAGEAIARDFGFRPILDHLAIFGHCLECVDAVQVGGEELAVPAEAAHQ